MKLWLEESAYQAIRTEAPKRRFLETGGALFGYEGDGGVVVVQAFGPGPRAKHRPRSFVPHRGTTAALIDQVWDESAGRYRFLGSWHTHPHARAVPSLTDTRTAVDMTRQDDLRLPEPLLLIQATRGIRDVELAELRAWRWSASSRTLCELDIEHIQSSDC